MANGILVGLFYILYSLLFLLKIGGAVEITYVQNAVAKGAVCLDGSPPAYYLDKAPVWPWGSGLNNWVVHVEGGGWCSNVTNCAKLTQTSTGSSKFMEKNREFTGILSNSKEMNPGFYNWNRVYVRYCDGSSFTGDIETVDPATNLHFRGARIFVAVLEDLLEKGMKNAQNALLSGCSAGGLTSMLHCDQFRDYLPWGTNVKCLADAGFFVNVVDISKIPLIENLYDRVVKLHQSAKNLHKNCTSRNAKKPGLCYFPQNFIRYIQTPVFVLNSAYDSFQIPYSKISDTPARLKVWQNCTTDISKCTADQLNVMHDFRLDFYLALVSTMGPSSPSGFFINSCYVHCQTDLQETWHGPNSPKLNGKTIAEAVGDWYQNKTRCSHQHIDCPYPCDNTCVHNRFVSPHSTQNIIDTFVDDLVESE